MRRITKVISTAFQFILTFVVLFIIFLIYAVLDIDDADMVNAIGFIVFQPLFAFGFSALTILVCFIIGLPIRFNNKFNGWWKTKPLIPVTGFVVGLILLVLAFNSNLTETKEIILNEKTVEKEVPNLTASIIGWFLVAFSLLHFYPVSLKSLFRKQKNEPVAE